MPDLRRELARLDRVLGDGWDVRPLPQVDVRVALPPNRRVPVRRLMRAGTPPGSRRPTADPPPF